MANYFRQISEQVKIEDVARELLGLKVSRAGFVSCPLHVDKTPSLKLYGTRFFCFSCGLKGDSIDLVSATKDVTKTEAAEAIIRYFNISVDDWQGARKIKRIKPVKSEVSAEQAKQFVDVLAEAACDLRKQKGVPGDLIGWLDAVHDEILADDDLRLADPARFIKKWEKIINEYNSYVRKHDEISRALEVARNRSGKYKYPARDVLAIMGRA